MEQPVEQPTQQPEWFENLIANYDTHNPEPGETLQATVIRKDQDGIFLDLGLKKELLIPQRDLENVSQELLDTLVPGSQVPVVVTSVASENREIEVSLGKGLEQQVWIQAQKNLQEDSILNLEVVDHNRGGLIVKYDDLRGFVPYSLVPELRGVRNPKRAEAIKNGMVGKAINVKITEVDPDRRRLILSAESAQTELRQNMLESFKKGQVISGKVVKVVDFGVFIDLGGIDGLVHISQLSWKKVKHPSEVIKPGDEIEVKVIEIDRERQRIGLSRKALLPGPWQTIAEELKPGDYLEGIVTRLVEFGAFAKIPQGVEGLIHSSQIGYSSHQDPQNAVKPGDRVLVKVLDIKPDRKRVALSMRQVPMERQIAWAMDTIEESTAPTKEDKSPVQPEPVAEQPQDQTPEQDSTPEQNLPANPVLQEDSGIPDQEIEKPVGDAASEEINETTFA